MKRNKQKISETWRWGAGVAAVILLLLGPTQSGFGGVLFDFNETGGSGTTWPGWAWYPNGADDFGHAGWRKNSGHWVSGDSNWAPRSFLKADSDPTGSATIDTASRAPSTSSGNSLKVYDTGSPYNVGWWIAYFDDTFGNYGYVASSDNRMDFYLKVTGLDDQGLTTDPSNGTIHVGTYLCWPAGGYGGESCPTEANGQHYYHYLTLNPDAWIHVQLDQHPTWQRDTAIPNNNPVGSSHPYFSSMNIFYVQVRAAQSQPTSYWIDEIKSWQQTQQENEDITSLWVGYWPSTTKWEVGFNDLSWGNSYSNYNDSTQSKFEIRWSTNSITNANWNSANPITPEYWRFGSTNSFRRPNPWKSVTWTRFSLPSDTESNSAKIYFAVKDTSSTADGDGHNAPTSNIKTIDYNLRPSGATPIDTTTPGSPTGLRIR